MRYATVAQNNRYAAHPLPTATSRVSTAGKVRVRCGNMAKAVQKHSRARVLIVALLELAGNTLTSPHVESLCDGRYAMAARLSTKEPVRTNLAQ